MEKYSRSSAGGVRSAASYIRSSWFPLRPAWLGPRRQVAREEGRSGEETPPATHADSLCPPPVVQSRRCPAARLPLAASESAAAPLFLTPPCPLAALTPPRRRVPSTTSKFRSRRCTSKRLPRPPRSCLVVARLLPMPMRTTRPSRRRRSWSLAPLAYPIHRPAEPRRRP